MEIYFKPEKLEKTANSEKKLTKKHGEQAGKISQRLGELAAMETLQDFTLLVPKARLHPYKGKNKGVWSVDIKHPYRILFTLPEDAAKKANGEIDRSLVTSVTITDLCYDPH